LRSFAKCLNRLHNGWVTLLEVLIPGRHLTFRRSDPAKKLSTGKQTACSHGEFLEAWHTEYRSTKTVVYEPLAKMRKIGVDYTMAAAERRSPARLLFGEPNRHLNSPPSNERLAWFENSDRYG
jgi:hypothetical protein